MSGKKDYFFEMSKVFVLAQAPLLSMLLSPKVVYRKHSVLFGLFTIVESELEDGIGEYTLRALGANDYIPIFRDMAVYCLVAPHFVAGIALVNMYLNDEGGICRPKLSPKSMGGVQHSVSDVQHSVSDVQHSVYSSPDMNANLNLTSSAQLPAQPRPSAGVSLNMHDAEQNPILSRTARRAEARAIYGNVEDVPIGESPSPTPRTPSAGAAAVRG